MKRLLLSLAMLAGLFCAPAHAAPQVSPCTQAAVSSAECDPVNSTNPLPSSISSWAGSVLGAMSNYGTSPGAVLVPGVNSFVTNANANGSATSANSSPVVIASDQAAVAVKTSDPCTSAVKSSKAIAITSGTTTSLVSVSGSTTVYVCGFSVTISQVVTTANTIQFEYGTGAACSSPTALTGTYGAGGVTAGIPIVVSYGNGGSTLFASAASNGVCALTAIGASGSFEGVLTYVQQ